VTVNSVSAVKNDVAAMGTGYHHLVCTHSTSVFACRYDNAAFAWTTAPGTNEDV
jgi:hypothetical protein